MAGKANGGKSKQQEKQTAGESNGGRVLNQTLFVVLHAFCAFFSFVAGYTWYVFTHCGVSTLLCSYIHRQRPEILQGVPPSWLRRNVPVPWCHA
jgi:hypothetical protein